MGLSLAILIVLGLVGIDQLIKFEVVSTIALGSSRILIPKVLALTNLHNDGAAWSMLAGKQTFFIIITILAIIVIGYFLYRYRQNTAMLIGLSFILAGAIGNFIDRLWQGYVVDMFEILFINFPIFNFADSCLTIGVIWLIICIIREKD